MVIFHCYVSSPEGTVTFFWVNCKDPSDLTRDDAFGWEVVEQVGEKRLVSDFRRNCVLFILNFT